MYVTLFDFFNHVRPNRHILLFYNVFCKYWILFLLSIWKESNFTDIFLPCHVTCILQSHWLPLHVNCILIGGSFQLDRYDPARMSKLSYLKCNTPLTESRENILEEKLNDDTYITYLWRRPSLGAMVTIEFYFLFPVYRIDV